MTHYTDLSTYIRIFHKNKIDTVTPFTNMD